MYGPLWIRSRAQPVTMTFDDENTPARDQSLRRGRPKKMNDRQNTVVATVIASLILVVTFLCPWRVETSEELQWSPIYQQPMSYDRMYDSDYGREGGSRIDSEEAEVAIDILMLEVAVVVLGGGLLFVLSADSDDEEAPSRAVGW